MIKIISHMPCADGFGVFFSAWKKYGNSSNIKYIGLSHGQSIPDDLVQEGDEVYICDFSFEREILLDWYDLAETIILLDHHVSAEKKVGDLHFTHFDMNHSGAWLAWRFFHPNTTTPKMIEYIEDRDLWNWKLPYSKEINSVIESFGFDFETWDELNEDITSDYLGVVEIGIALERYKDRLIDRACSNAHSMSIGGRNVMAVNSSLLQSEIGNELLVRYPESPFSVIYSERENSTNYSLRSEDKRDDVSLIASTYGGGGHRNSSGFIVSKGEC